MRTPADLPRRIPRASRRTRIIAVAAVVAVIVLITSLSGLAHFWTDYLWFQSVGFTSVFRGVLLTKVLLALVFMAIFFAMMLGNLYIADRVAPEEAAPDTADELVVRYREVVSPHAKVVRIVTAAVFAILAGDRRQPGVEQLGPAPLPRLLREFRPRVPQRHRLLRLPVAVHQVPARLGLRSADRGVHRDHGRPLPQRRHPSAGRRPARDSRRQDPPVGPARRARAHQGRRLLLPAARAGALP